MATMVKPIKKKTQTPADFEPKSKFPRTPGGGDNYNETIKREKELKKKGIMKKGGSVKKKMEMGGSAESNVFTIPSRNKISIPKKSATMMKKGGTMKKCKYGCK